MATPAQQQAFLNKIIPLAIADMKKTKVLASLTIAQAILESAWGLSGLTVRSNNLFGIKGQGVNSATFEYINGKRIEIVAGFKAYPDWETSISDHSGLFLRLSRYKNLIGCTDYKQACKNVQVDGYATAPNYADSLIKLIEQYKLYQYDVITVDKPQQTQQKIPDHYTVTFMPKTKGEAETIKKWVQEHANYYADIKEVY